MTVPFTARSYDLHLTAGERRLVLRNTDRGVRLGDWRIGWTANGRDEDAGLETIAEVRMQSGGYWQNPLNACVIRFRNGGLLTIHDGTEYGVADEANTPVYRDFVRDLHRHLAAAPAGTISFIAGYPQGLHVAMMVCAGLFALMGIATPIVLFAVTGKFQMLLLLIAGIGFCWPLWKMAQNNAPRTYDPRRPPGELME